MSERTITHGSDHPLQFCAHQRSPVKVRDLIRRLRSRALYLPFERVDDIIEFKGTECDFQDVIRTTRTGGC